MPPLDLHRKTGLALSIRQPWAWLIVHGHKVVENRKWRTATRGWVGIHAGKTLDTDGLDFVRDEFPHIALPETFDRGGMVGCARLVGCVDRLDSPWFFGPVGFLFEDARPLPFCACKGQLGFFRPQGAPHA